MRLIARIEGWELSARGGINDGGEQWWGALNRLRGWTAKGIGMVQR